MDRWVALTATKNSGTAATYLAGVYYELRKRGVRHCEHHRATRRTVIAAAKRTRRGPLGKDGIYREDLELELEHLIADPNATQEQFVTFVAAVVALCAGLRASDYAPTKAATKNKKGRKGKGGVAAAPQRPLRRKDVRFGQDRDGVRWAQLSLKRSKWWNRTTSFTLHETKSSIDCYKWLRWTHKLNRRNGPRAFLLPQSKDGKVPTYSNDISRLCKRVKARLVDQETKITPHSLRVGTARSLMLGKVQRQDINAYMRWRSNGGDVYLQMAPQDFHRARAPRGKRWRSTEMILGASAVRRKRPRSLR
jgi:hypothetical protein